MDVDIRLLSHNYFTFRDKTRFLVLFAAEVAIYYIARVIITSAQNKDDTQEEVLIC